jgi:dCMP deaminase
MKYKYQIAIMKMAREFAKTSEANRLKVGAILYKNDNIIALGVNGTRAGWHTNECEDKYGNTTPAVRHAEIAALDKLRKSSESSVGATLFCTHSPCLACAVELVDAGIAKVVYHELYRSSEGISYLEEKGIPVEWIDIE